VNKFLLIIFLFLSFSSFGQIKLGIKAGATFSQQKNSGIIYPVTDLKYNKSFQTGVNINLQIFKNFEYLFFQPELFFIQKGYEYSGVYDFGNGDVKYKDKITYDYLELPFNFKLLIPLTPFYLFGGGYASYCLGGFNKFISGEILIENELNISENGILFYDAGFQSGVGIQKGLGATKFVLEGKFGMGLIDINYSSPVILKNKYFGLSIGIQMQPR
jgi:hypothetical protein